MQWSLRPLLLLLLLLTTSDVLFCHRPDPDTPIEETVRAMNWVINKGWAFYWGTSEWSREQLEEVRATFHHSTPQHTTAHRSA